MEGTDEWPEGWRGNAIVDNTVDGASFIGVVALGVPRGASIKDSVVTVCTELEELLTISVRGTGVERGPGGGGGGVVWEGVTVLVVGEDVISDVGGGA